MRTFRLPVRYPSVKPLRENTACRVAISGSLPSRAVRTAVTAAATYSGRFMRPSIFTEQTPAASRSRTRVMKLISFNDRA